MVSGAGDADHFVALGVVLPVIGFALAANRCIVSGMTAGAVKG